MEKYRDGCVCCGFYIEVGMFSFGLLKAEKEGQESHFTRIGSPYHRIGDAYRHHEENPTFLRVLIILFASVTLRCLFSSQPASI